MVVQNLSSTVTAISKANIKHPYDYVASHKATFNLYNRSAPRHVAILHV